MFGPAYEERADRLGSLARSTIELPRKKRCALSQHGAHAAAIIDQSVEAIGLEPKLVQAADLIGQLMYPKKANALFYEFEEAGMNRPGARGRGGRRASARERFTMHLLWS
jgi:hypothetical protein